MDVECIFFSHLHNVNRLTQLNLDEEIVVMSQMDISILDLLENIEFFKGFTDDELNDLLNAGEWYKASVGQTIITEGDMDLFMYVLIQGQVDVVLNEKVLASLQRGDTFGEFGLMGERRTAHVTARSNCLFLRFNADRLNQLPLSLQIKFLKKILFTLFARLQKVNRQVWWNLPTQWR